MQSSEKLSCDKLQSVLHNEIPLTRTMQISVAHCDANKVELHAPLEPNINHKCTAFGGSLYSVAVLCGWGFIYHQMQLHKLSGHIVIQHSEADYKTPVDGEICAVCELGDELDDRLGLQKFINIYQRKGKARIKLQVDILFADQSALKFIGHYVVHQ